MIYCKLAGINQLVNSKLNEIYKNDLFTGVSVWLSPQSKMLGLGLENFNDMIQMEVE